MELEDAIGIYQTHYSQIDIVWGYFSTVSIAILGLTIGSERLTKKLIEFRAVQIGYFIFSMGNYSALISGQKDLIKINKYISSIQVCNINKIDFTPIGLFGLSVFYWMVVGAVILGLHYIYKARLKEL